MRFAILLSLATCCLAAAADPASAEATAAQGKPNIILLVTDDQGWGDVGYNGHPHIQTPVLDEMARTGIRFDAFYAAASTCAPSRAAMMTGRNNIRVGTHVPALKSWHLGKSEITFPEILQKQGYATAHFGKWHLGTLYTDKKDSEHNLFPDEAGFDEYFTSENILYTYDPYQGLPKGKGPEHMYVHNGRFIPLEEGQKIPELRRDDATILADRTIDFITRQNTAGKSFMVALWFHHVHSPLSDNPELIKLYQGKGLKDSEITYYSNITSVDREVGRIRSQLRDLGIAGNTIVIFTSDNGPHGGTQSTQRLQTVEVNGANFLYGDRGSSGPYRGGKWQTYEGGLRVPLVMEWPKAYPKPIRSTMRTNGMDLFPTILDIVGVPLPDGRAYDGISWVAHLQGKQDKRGKPMPFVVAGQRSYIDGDFKICSERRSRTFTELYNLKDDPFEQKNLITSMPERFAAMLASYRKWEDEALEDSEDGPTAWGSKADNMRATLSPE